MNYRSLGYMLMFIGILSIGLIMAGFFGLFGDFGLQSAVLALAATLICFILGEVVLRQANKVAWESCLNAVMICSKCGSTIARSQWLQHEACPECGCSDYV